MKRLLFLIVSSLSVALSAQTENFWTKKSDFAGMKRERMVGFSINDKGYAGMGCDTNETVKNDWWMYDALTDVWTQKASLPGSVRRNAVGFEIAGKGYVGTGIDSAEAFNGNKLKDFWQYDPVANSWQQKADYPGGGGNGVYFATGFSLDGKGYICCGKIGPALYIDELWEYKPFSDSWSQRADFPPGPRYQLSSFTIHDKAYVGLGTDYNVYKQDFWIYNPGSNVWTQTSNFGGGVRGSASTFTLGERGFVCLGVDGGLKKDLWEFDPYLQTWTARDSYDGSERKSAIAFTSGGKAYVGTGDGYSGKKQSMYEYTPMLILGTEENTAGARAEVFPTLVDDHYNIRTGAAASGTAVLYSLNGQVLQQFALTAGTLNRQSRESLPAGMYLLVISSADAQVMTTQKLLFR